MKPGQKERENGDLRLKTKAAGSTPTVEWLAAIETGNDFYVRIGRRSSH